MSYIQSSIVIRYRLCLLILGVSEAGVEARQLSGSVQEEQKGLQLPAVTGL